MCYLKLNFHTNNVPLDNKVILVTVQNARAFSRLGERKWEERNGRSMCYVRVFGNVFVEEVFEEPKQDE